MTADRLLSKRKHHKETPKKSAAFEKHTIRTALAIAGPPVALAFAEGADQYFGLHLTDVGTTLVISHPLSAAAGVGGIAVGGAAALFPGRAAIASVLHWVAGTIKGRAS